MNLNDDEISSRVDKYDRISFHNNDGKKHYINKNGLNNVIFSIMNIITPDFENDINDYFNEIVI